MPWAVAIRSAGQRLGGDGGELEGGSHGVVDPGCDAHGRPSCLLWEGGAVFQLRFTTLVEAPLTVAFDVARTLGPPVAEPAATRSSPCGRRATSTRSGPAGRVALADRTRGGSPPPAPARWSTSRSTGRPGCPACSAASSTRWCCGGGSSGRCRRTSTPTRRPPRARALDVVQVVGAAIVDGDRVLVAQRSGGPYDGCWEFPGGKVEPGESDLSALVRECARGAGRRRRAAGVPRRGACWTASVGGGPPGVVDAAGLVGAHLPAGRRSRTSTRRCAGCGPTSSTTSTGSPPTARSLPAVRALLARL